MTFAAPLFLLAALAAAVPVILHMINRRRAKDLPFSTLRFLKISVQKTRRRKRIHDLLLMLLRAAVLLLIAAGLARPAVTQLGSLWGGGHSAVAIILDNSASMGMIDDGQERLTTAKASVAQILQELKSGDQAALFTPCGPTFSGWGVLQRTQDQTISQILPDLQVSYETADLPPLLHQAQEVLSKSMAENKYVFVITDMQKVSWGVENHPLAPGESPGANDESPRLGGESPGVNDESSRVGNKSPEINDDNTKIPVVVVNCNRNPKPDAALTDLAVEAAIPVTGLPVNAAVQLQNASTVPQSAVLELYVDGTLEQSSPAMPTSPGGRVNYVFTFAIQRGGLHRCEVRLAGEDGSKFDDRRFAALEINQGIPVAIVAPPRHDIPYLDDAYYLEEALTGNDALKVTTLAAGDLLKKPLADYRVIFCVNLPALDSPAADRLSDYVNGGGNLVWIAGGNVDPEAYNRMNEQSGGRLLPVPLKQVRAAKDAWHIASLDKNFPPFRTLQEPAELYQSILVYRHVSMEVPLLTPARLMVEASDDQLKIGPQKPVSRDKMSRTRALAATESINGDVRILARLDDDEPLLAMRPVEQGQVLFWGTGAHVDWTNFPLRKIFLPLVTKLTFHLAGVEQAERRATAGEPIALNFDKAVQPLDIEIIPPSGESLQKKTQSEPGKPGQHFRYPDTHQIGIYTLRIPEGAKTTSLTYAVNYDPREADPQTIDQAELRKRWNAAPLLFAENPENLSETFARLREGKSLWGLFLSGVLLVLVFETFLSNRLGPKT